MPPTNPTSRRYLRVTWRLVFLVTLVALTGVEGYYGTGLLTDLWSSQAKMEGIVLKAEWWRIRGPQ
jgi:hypothetical protein